MTDISRFIILIFLVFCSCGQEEKDDGKDKFRIFSIDKATWLAPKASHKLDLIAYNAATVPLEYYVARQQTYSTAEVDSITKATRQERIIEFEFSEETGQDLLNEKFTKMDYTNSIQYISFQIQDDFYVVTSGNDTIACAGVVTERSYKVAPSQKILLFFTGVTPGENLQLVYDDKLFGKGIMKFLIDDNVSKTGI